MGRGREREGERERGMESRKERERGMESMRRERAIRERHKD